MSESESYHVSAVEFAALDALGEVFRQLATYERSLMTRPTGTFTYVIAGTGEISFERAAALSAWWRMLAGPPRPSTGVVFVDERCPECDGPTMLTPSGAVTCHRYGDQHFRREPTSKPPAKTVRVELPPDRPIG